MVPAPIEVTCKTRDEICADWFIKLTPELKRYLGRYHSYVNRADQEDVLHEAFLAFLGNSNITGSGYRGDLSSRRGVLCYLRAAAGIEARNHMQRETGTRDPNKAVQVVSLSTPEVAQELEQCLAVDETEEALEAARVYQLILEPLPKTLQILVDRYWIHNETLESIMSEMGYKRKTDVLRRLWAARKLLVLRLLEVKRLRREGKL